MPNQKAELERNQPLVSEAHGLKTLTLTTNAEYQMRPPERSETHSRQSLADQTEAEKGQFQGHVNYA